MDLLRSPTFSTYVQQLMDRNHVPGLAIAVAQDGAIASAGFGKASLNPPKDCTADTLFDIASASKSVTAASVAILVTDNEKYPHVQYDATMSSLLPNDFVLPGEDHNNVTVEDILSHRTGMAPHDFSYLGAKAAQPDDAKTITNNLRNLPVVAPNRTEYIYNNMLYTVASYLVEQMSGLSFSAFLEENIFQPLGMESTNLQPGRARVKGLGDRIAIGYFWDSEAKKYNPISCSDSPEAQGAGKIITSANDYIKWVQAVMKQEGPITEDIYRGLLKKRISIVSLDDLGADNSESRRSSTFYAAGWQVRDCGTYRMVWHEGSDEGFTSTHFFVPELEFSGVILCNSDGASHVIKVLTHELVEWVVQSTKLAIRQWVPTLGEADTELESASEGQSEDGNTTDSEGELRRELCPNCSTEKAPRELPLSAYAGEYWNPGYRHIKVQEKDGKLFVDATDRSMDFTMTFKHICDQTKYIAYMSEGIEGGESPIKAEFKLKNGYATELGLHLECMLKDYIWFKRVDF